uniref:RAB, member RAS onco family like 6 n=1 Tax=Cyclopterus lumpus TaxID=8103 RepID=A0A8C2WU67_CYCLU
MFSALKKLVGSEPGQLRDKNIPAGLQSMNQSLQRRFAKGVQYNMKIVIRGDRNTGKSTLWHRLQGKKFVEEYLPTQEIQATSIHWNYKSKSSCVHCMFDHHCFGRKGKKRGENLKLENEPQESDEVALDAEFLDVYKNCNGIIMMFDITKQWTFNYILRELPKVPTHVPVCVLGNHRDMGEHRVILPDDIRDLIAGLNRPMGASYIHYAESSMKNGFGLKYLHRFFNIPFLQLQRETLLRQLETNQLDMDATLEELCVQQETEDQNYEIFLENLETRSKGFGSPGPANGQSPDSGSQSPIVPPSGASTGSSSPSTPQPPVPFQALPQSPSVSAASPLSPPPPAPGGSAPQKRGFISRWFGSSPAAEAPASAPDEPPAPVCPANVQSVDDFVPDERLDRSFLEDSLPSRAKGPPQPAAAVDSDSDGEDRGNPMVSGFMDELDPDDTEPSLPPPKTLPPRKDVTLTSDEDDGVPAAPAVAQNQDLDSEPELKSAAPISLTLTPAAQQLPRHQGKKKGSPPRAEDSDTDPEAPVAHQMLSYVMDDPDFESEVSDTPKITKDIFPVRDELLSDLSDDGMQLATVPEPLKPTVISFKHKDDTDLFGLGLQEEAPAAKESSEEPEDKESKHSSKDKKKKKKKSKEVKLSCVTGNVSKRRQRQHNSLCSSVFRKTKRTRRNTNRRRRKKTRLQRSTRKRKRRRRPGPRKRKWTSWRTFWAEEQRRSKEMTEIMKNCKKKQPSWFLDWLVGA